MSIIVNKNIIGLDSLQFYKGPLDSLTENLEDKDFKHLMLEFPLDKLEILKIKYTCTYEWVDSYKYLFIPDYHLKNVFIHQ